MQKKFLSDKHVANRYDVSRATVWRWAKKGYLPAPIQLSPGCSRWDGEALDKCDAERMRRG